MTRKVYKGRVVLPDQIIENGVLVVTGATITFVGEEASFDVRDEDEVVDYSSSYICPGFIDIHVHGNAGHDVMDGTEEAIDEISHSLARFGVTGFLPTTMTAPMDEIRKVIENIHQMKAKQTGGAQVLGVHLEGPWISEVYKGAQNGAYISNPTSDEVDQVLTWIDDLPCVVTIAPEISGAVEAIKSLTSRGIICSIGHTNATHEEVSRAVENGASHFTHAFNAMRGLHHREPGVVGALMGMKQMTCDVIADLVHTHASILDILYQLKGREKLLLISDGMRAVGLPDGEYSLGGQTVIVRQCIARLADSTLAGSTLSLQKAVHNMVDEIGVPLIDAVYMAATAPATKLGISHSKGSLAVGKDADIAVLSADFRVVETIVKGIPVYKEELEQ
ncbi:N-acetylglucosamine-6-phosphate deacetylase [Brevibacillus sp. SYSU BS000544]|uniref:N-acetylglucosamine-6-phosphate deacetylase n=1 Tax=Brevibacillus sp. SYSU BS000544 TaxID=3416443 RepID=UPI003CE590FF